MARSQISIKLESKNLEGVDAAAQALEITRTEFIERAVVKALAEYNALVADMAAEPAVVQVIVDALAGNKPLMLGMAKLMAPHLSDEQVSKAIESQPNYRKEATRRKQQGKRKKTEGK